MCVAPHLNDEPETPANRRDFGDKRVHRSLWRVSPVGKGAQAAVVFRVTVGIQLRFTSNCEYTGNDFVGQSVEQIRRFGRVVRH